MAKVDPTPGVVPPEEEPSEAAELAVSAELVATSVPEYLKAALARVRGGEMGILPVVGGLLLVSIIFQSLNSHFLTAANLVALLVQAALFSMLAMGEIYALLLGEIDLSIGFVAGLGGVILAELLKPTGFDWPWWAAIAVSLAACALIGLIQGSLITRLGLPSFIVTLAGLLFWQGLMLRILGNGGSILVSDATVNGIASGNLTPAASWIVMLAIVGIFGVMTWRRDARRRAAGLVAPPKGVTGLKIGGALAGGVVVVLLCNADRGRLVPIQGVPYVVLLVFLVLALWTFVLGRLRFGRYIYAIGGNAEAARRAGVNLSWIRTFGFVMCSLTAGIGGLIYVSRLRSISTAVEGGTLVLYAVAAAVIGGTSLFGGRGKAVHGVLGGIVIAAIYNGMGLLGVAAPTQYMVTALVLLAAVTIDSLARKGRSPGR
ncbi:MAG TPA: ABC transporter permease [Actinomycetota bacterium]|nr:ABC transporter permease [Actinomycetota bacterium]